ncbi:fimbrial protein [Cupriavidus sp. IDO]|uniref:fimbrial protein n=1 Tax=Cupriavidus sp. IDO TaxID=1539142 RepID=UPI000579499C|nr:fimbrial protein [Cupriavidus sp. IDO]KWR81583.1 fimbrial protein [Cupriavidus sp. IDO]
MKTKLISAATVLGAALASQLANAADGTITFTGNITSQTCTISGNGSGGKDFTVALPKVSTASLSTAGKTAGRTPFTINLSACTPTSGMKLSAGDASNVQIALLNGIDASDIKAGATDAAQNSKSVALSGGSATLSYYAQYYATGVATAGTANSSVMYTIAYQ